MLTRMTVYMTPQERDAISTIARDEYRDIRQQAAILIRDELTRRGMLSQEQPTEPATSGDAGLILVDFYKTLASLLEAKNGSQS